MLDVHFSHPRVQDVSLPQDACLRFLTIVEAASVPLFLAAGPSLDVWTNDETTRDWLYNCVTDGADNSEEGNSGRHWIDPGRQSRFGILLGVKDGLRKSARSGRDITEVLLYAAASRLPPVNHAPPSPPASSSPGRDNHTGSISSILRLYAIPLSSKILFDMQQIPDQQQPDATPHGQGYYLPTLPDGTTSCSLLNTHTAKRPKIETLFTDAAHNRRQQKKRGGEGIAKAMAGAPNGFTIPALPSPIMLDLVEAKEKRSSVSLVRGPLSRSSTTGSITSVRSVPPVSRPQNSRRLTLTNGQRSSLHRVESVLSPSVDGTNSPAPEESHHSTDIEQQNKTSLSRIIMTGMRMYGFPPQRKKSIGNLQQDSQTQRLSPLDGPPPIEDTTNSSRQDEYKAVYHQTFKAVSFVFRTYWARRVLSQDVLRDTVDGFLGTFCEDPFADPPVHETVFDDGGSGPRLPEKQ
ncbi:MAG: hypothetical protein Q9185_000494 [Variospora sp. 1 TL-2023]